MYISFVLETFKYKSFLSHQFTKFSICLWYIASSSSLIFPTSSVSSANFTTGHDSSVLLQRAVYSANKEGAKTVPWGAPVFVLIAVDSNPFSFTYWSIFVRHQMQGLFRQHLAFSLNLKVSSTRLWLQLISAPGNVLVFMHCRVRMKSVRLQTCLLGECQVAVHDSLWGWRMLARVRWWLLANSRRHWLLSLVFPMPNHPTVPAKFWCASEPTLAFQSPWPPGSLSLELSKWWSPVIHRTPRFPCHHSLKLEHRLGWWSHCAIWQRCGWRQVCWRWVCSS